jgi:hypothetical protein
VFQTPCAELSFLTGCWYTMGRGSDSARLSTNFVPWTQGYVGQVGGPIGVASCPIIESSGLREIRLVVRSPPPPSLLRGRPSPDQRLGTDTLTSSPVCRLHQHHEVNRLREGE